MSSLGKLVRRRVLAAIDALGEEPRPPGCRKLIGADAWHIRAAKDWRIVYVIQDHVLLVTVVDAGHRRKIYQ
ncbi:type II toxin-antitoxin system RelE family toxin [Saccharomonospora marina]|nr:type II toxin-antitoxin system RelE/ParE family toxin [Saccharomonospora marina]